MQNNATQVVSKLIFKYRSYTDMASSESEVGSKRPRTDAPIFRSCLRKHFLMLYENLLETQDLPKDKVTDFAYTLDDEHVRPICSCITTRVIEYQNMVDESDKQSKDEKDAYALKRMQHLKEIRWICLDINLIQDSISE